MNTNRKKLWRTAGIVFIGLLLAISISLEAGGQTANEDRVYVVATNKGDWLADHWPQILWVGLPLLALVIAFYAWNVTLRQMVRRRTGELRASQAQAQ